MFSSSFVRPRRGRAALTLLGIAALGLAAHPAAAQGLNGQPVNDSFGQGATPQGAFYSSDLGTQTITSAGVTFTGIGMNALVTPNQIMLNASTRVLFGNPGFTGFRFSEVGPSPQTITGASLDPATIASGFGADRLSFDANDIYVNFNNLNIGPGQNVTINFTTAQDSAPVPEASTTVSLGLMLALGGLAFAVKRKKAHAA